MLLDMCNLYVVRLYVNMYVVYSLYCVYLRVIVCVRDNLKRMQDTEQHKITQVICRCTHDVRLHVSI